MSRVGCENASILEHEAAIVGFQRVGLVIGRFIVLQNN